MHARKLWAVRPPNRTLILFCAAIGAALCASPSRGEWLNDNQLWFDPDSITPDYYPRRLLEDPGSLVWTGQQGRKIVGANILPYLRPGEYLPGYVFSQQDYGLRPQVDYRADLTAGILTAQFDRPGPYQVRLLYDDGSVAINTALVATGIGDGGEHPKGNKTGVPVKMPGKPRGKTKAPDLYLVSTGIVDPGNPQRDDKFVRYAFDNLNNKRLPVGRVGNVTTLKSTISAWFRELGRKINVVVIAHGNEGAVRIGPEGSPNTANHWIMRGFTDPGDLARDIAPWAKSLTFFSCKTGRGAAGAEFLRRIANRGVIPQAWNGTVYAGEGNWWGLDRGVSNVPEPASILLVLLVAAYATSRRALRRTG